MNELHLFAGAGGGILGGILLGHTCVCAVEIESYCRKVLLSRQRDGILPKFPIWDDVRTFDGKPWRGSVDVVSGGFPCQDISVAGTGEGLDGQRSGLWREMARIIGEVRPKNVVVENSPMLAIRGLDRVLADLTDMGFNARWGIISAKDTGLCHKRSRLWIVANSDLRGRTWREETTERVLRYESLVARQYRRLDTSEIHGANDELANRMDRLHAIGNGQVPAVVKLAWETLE